MKVGGYAVVPMITAIFISLSKAILIYCIFIVNKMLKIQFERHGYFCLQQLTHIRMYLSIKRF